MAKQAAKVKNESANHRPSYDVIAVRAYEIYLDRGATHGHDLDDWLAAERELTALTAKTKARRASASASL